MTKLNETFVSIREKLARAIHENYLKNQRGTKSADDPGMQPWERLREDLKESNRQQADQIPEKLKVIGCSIRPAGSGETGVREFTPEEVELLAKMEHNRWMANKMAAGWTYAPPPRDDVKKTHPCLVPWEELPDDEREKDRQAVRGIPEFLATAGFEIRRLE